MVRFGAQGRRCVRLHLDYVYAHGRQIRAGITRYGQVAGWLFDSPPPWRFQRGGTTPAPHRADVQGRIVTLTGDPEVDDAFAGGCPSVSVSSVIHPRIPTVASDNRLVGQLAARHLLDRQLHHLGALVIPHSTYALERAASFLEVATAAGAAISRLEAWIDRTEGREALLEWLVRLPKPAGLLASNDYWAWFVLDACREAELRVPEDIAVVGVDDDEMIVDITDPPLTSVALGADRIGYAAAELLDRLIDGEPPPGRPVLIPPLGLVPRRSTDVVAVADRDVIAAVRFMREHENQPLTVDDVARSVGVGRRSLERRFSATLGRTILDEIHRIRVERVKRLLVETDLTIEGVAAASGFRTSTRLGIVFKKVTGTTPAQWRRELSE